MNLFVLLECAKLNFRYGHMTLQIDPGALQNIFYARSTCNEAVEQFCSIVDQFCFTYLNFIVGFSITSVIVQITNY